MSLVPDYGESSSSSDEDSDENSKSEEQPAETLKTCVVLPRPNFKDGKPAEPQHSVFKNPFAEAENAKEAILQKHVKMVDTKNNVVIINGKKICWNYRKGRCRFGHNCKFAHDSDIQKTKEELQGEKETALQQNQISSQPDSSIEISADLNKQKRKRPGLTQGLVPGKKVMKAYNTLSKKN